MKRRMKNFVFILVVVLIVAGIFLIDYVKSNGESNEQVMKCIAENSQLFVSKTCGHCATQKQNLGEYLDYFNIVDCITNREECEANDILAVPTWIIDGQKTTGVQSIEKLKKLTGC